MSTLDCCVKTGKMAVTESREVLTVKQSSDSIINMAGADAESQQIKSIKSQRLRWIFLVDIPLLLLVIGVPGLFNLGVLPVQPAGFFCNDPALNYDPPRAETVSTTVLMVSVLLVVPAVIFATELLLQTSEPMRGRFSCSRHHTLVIYRSYMYGLVVNLSIFQIIKITMGNPRPIFFKVCQPDRLSTCNGTEFVSTFVCTSNYSTFTQIDSYQSFPSGHTALSVYAGLFMIWYLQRRAFSWRNRSVLLVPTLQILICSFSVVCSISRITDHMHHWWDVLVGVAIGVVTALFAVRVLLKNFS